MDESTAAIHTKELRSFGIGILLGQYVGPDLLWGVDRLGLATGILIKRVFLTLEDIEVASG